MQDQLVPGMMLVLVTRDSVLYSGGLGFASVARKTPVTERHLFRMGSVTKMVTALGILSLVKAGKLSLNDPVRKLAPELPIVNPWEATHPIRVVHLLEHTAGFSDKPISLSYNPKPQDLPTLEAVRVFKGSLVSRWKPGERHSYANPDYNVAAYLIQKLSGQRWDEYVKRAILEPMGMLSANLNLRADGSGRYAQGYFWQEGSYQLTPFLPQYQGGNGSLNASAADMASFLQCYLYNWKTVNNTQFLSPQLLDEAETVHSTLAARSGLTKTGYGLGHEAYDGPDGFQFWGHKGSIGAFVSSVGYNRELGVGYAFAYNRSADIMPAERLIRSFLTQGYTPSEPRKYPLDAKAIAPYLGYYQFDSPKDQLMGILEQLRFRFELRQERGQLIQHPLMGSSFSLEATSPTHFRMPWDHYPIVSLVTDADGNRAVEHGGLYFRQISGVEAWLPLILLISSLIVLATSVAAGLVWLVMILMSRIRGIDVPLRLLPMLSTIALGVTLYLGLTRFGRHVTEGTNMMPDFWVIFSSTLLFAICAVAAIILLGIRWRHIDNNWLKGYLLVVVLAGLYMTAFFGANGWIGLRMWAL